MTHLQFLTRCAGEYFCDSEHKQNVFHILRDPCVTRKGAVRCPYGHVRELTQPWLAKIPHGRRIWPYGARTDSLRSLHGLFTGCLQSLYPYGTRKLIMHALKLYGPVRGGRIRTAPHRARACPVSGRTIFVQNSPWTAREQPVRGPGVWCDWGIMHKKKNNKHLHKKPRALLQNKYCSFLIKIFS